MAFDAAARKRKHTNSSLLQMLILNTARFVLVCIWLLAVVVGGRSFVSSHGFSHRAVNSKIISGSVDTCSSYEQEPFEVSEPTHLVI